MVYTRVDPKVTSLTQILINVTQQKPTCNKIKIFSIVFHFLKGPPEGVPLFYIQLKIVKFCVSVR